MPIAGRLKRVDQPGLHRARVERVAEAEDHARQAEEEQAAIDGGYADVGERPEREGGFGKEEGRPPPAGVCHHPRGDLEQGHSRGERRVRHEHLEDR